MIRNKQGARDAYPQKGYKMHHNPALLGLKRRDLPPLSYAFSLILRTYQRRRISVSRPQMAGDL